MAFLWIVETVLCKTLMVTIKDPDPLLWPVTLSSMSRQYHTASKRRTIATFPDEICHLLIV